MQPSAGPIAGVEQFVGDWSGRLLSTGPLTEAERTATVDAVRRCYRQAGLPWPGRVVWAPSPVAGQRMANELSRRHAGRAVRARTVARWVRQAVRPEAAGLLAFAAAGLLLASEVVVTLLALLPGDPVIRSAGDSWAQGSGAWIGGVAGGLAAVAPLAKFTWERARGYLLRPVFFAMVLAATGIPALGALCGVAVGRWVSGPLGGADPPTWGWIRTLLAVTLIPAVLAIAVLGGVPDYPELRFPGDPAYQRLRGRPGPAPAAAGPGIPAAGFGWWPHTEFVVIGERPSTLRVDSGRLHCTGGPAAEWSDGFRIHALHGVQVPADLVERGWDVDRIHAEPNSEVRRVAIELMGWDVYVRRAGWRRIATAPDPGNPPHKLVLYADPHGRAGGVHLLVMTNGSPDRTGEHRRYAETVPATITDPVEAAAWQYGCSARVYRQLQRRT